MTKSQPSSGYVQCLVDAFNQLARVFCHWTVWLCVWVCVFDGIRDNDNDDNDNCGDSNGVRRPPTHAQSSSSQDKPESDQRIHNHSFNYDDSISCLRRKLSLFVSSFSMENHKTFVISISWQKLSSIQRIINNNIEFCVRIKGTLFILPYIPSYIYHIFYLLR